MAAAQVNRRRTEYPVKRVQTLRQFSFCLQMSQQAFTEERAVNLIAL